MAEVHRQFDTNTAGAEITSVVQQSVYVNNLLASVDGSKVQSHRRHFHPETANGSNNVFIENIPVNRRGDNDTCGHSRNIGSLKNNLSYSTSQE
jgi:uncharacterized Zn-binding protein involved in type VI secretion